MMYMSHDSGWEHVFHAAFFFVLNAFREYDYTKYAFLKLCLS